MTKKPRTMIAKIYLSVFTALIVLCYNADGQDQKKDQRPSTTTNRHEAAKSQKTSDLDLKTIAKKMELVKAEHAGRDVIYLNHLFAPVPSQELAQIKFYALIDEGKDENIVQVFSLANNRLRASGTDSTKKTKAWTGAFTFLYDNGKVESEGMYEEGIKVGEWKRFTPEGEEKLSKFYSDERRDGVKKMNEQASDKE